MDRQAVTASARLSPAIEGVMVDIRLNDRELRVVIAGSVFETCFAARDPQEWLQSYQQNRSVIERVVCRKALHQPNANFIVILERDIQ
jgi:hypothetical protein